MNAEYIQEPERTLPVRYADYDVIVAGGGIAGIAAALAAARAGKRVLLLERMFALGGLATLGLVTIYLPLCDGKGHQLSFGRRCCPTEPADRPATIRPDFYSSAG